MPRQPPFATLPSLLLVGTLLGTPGPGQVPSLLQLDHGDYQATCIDGTGEDCTYGFTVIARLVNRTTDTLFISRCRPGDPGPVYGVEVVGDTSEEAAYDPFWACVGHDNPIVISPRATRIDTLRLEGPNVRDGKTLTPQGRFEGEFRLVYDLAPCQAGRGSCGTLPAKPQSDVFRVHLAR